MQGRQGASAPWRPCGAAALVPGAIYDAIVSTQILSPLLRYHLRRGSHVGSVTGPVAIGSEARCDDLLGGFHPQVAAALNGWPW